MEARQIYINSVCSSDCMAHWCGKEQTSVALQYKSNTAHHTIKAQRHAHKHMVHRTQTVNMIVAMMQALLGTLSSSPP